MKDIATLLATLADAHGLSGYEDDIAVPAAGASWSPWWTKSR